MPCLVSKFCADFLIHAEIEALGQCTFDVAICNMVLMDMPVISPLLAGLTYVLKVKAPLVSLLLA